MLPLLLLSLLASTPRTTAKPLISFEVNYDTFLHRADPTWSWGSSINTTGPTEWVSSLFGGNGNLGFQLYSPTPTTLQLDISSKSLWDDRTPDLLTPPSVAAQNKTYYTGNFVKDQPRLPSGHFNITWSSNAPPILAVGRMSLYNGRAELKLVCTPDGSGFSIVVWVNAAYEKADVIVIEIHPFGATQALLSELPELPTVVFVPANLTQTPSCSHCVHNPAAVLSTTSQLHTVVQPHLKGTAHATVFAVTKSATSLQYVVAVSPVLPSQALASKYAANQIAGALDLGVDHLQQEHQAWWHAWWTL